MKTRGLHMQPMTEARIASKYMAGNVIILDTDKDEILAIWYPENRETFQLIYNPACAAYPRGYFDAYIDGKVVKVGKSSGRAVADDDYDLLCSALRLATSKLNGLWTVKDYIDQFKYIEQPSGPGRLLTSDAYACQLKLGRALLRFDMNHPTRQMNRREYVELDSSHLSSCIEQALKSENVSQLANVLAEYESQSRSVYSPEHETEVMTTPVSRDACKLFMFSGSSVEATVFRQLVVERINTGYVTTALKLCCIGHQIPFCRDNMNTNLIPISDVQTLRDSFDRMLSIESYEQERSRFLSICDEWYRVLEPQGLMNIEQRELLREWISTRQYANTEDPMVSLVIEKCYRKMYNYSEESRGCQRREDVMKKKKEEQRISRNVNRNALILESIHLQKQRRF